MFRKMACWEDILLKTILSPWRMVQSITQGAFGQMLIVSFVYSSANNPALWDRGHDSKDRTLLMTSI